MPQISDFHAPQAAWATMAGGAHNCPLELKNNPEPLDCIYVVLYGLWDEAVLPTNLEYNAPKVKLYAGKQNESSLEDALDQLDEARDVALLR